jgi:hypothetical protein
MEGGPPEFSIFRSLISTIPITIPTTSPPTTTMMMRVPMTYFPKLLMIAISILVSNNNLLVMANARMSVADYISTDVTCYEYGEAVELRFSTTMPTMQNWVGIYYENEDNNSNKEQLVQSQWVCGSHDDECGDMGRMTFDHERFPLTAATAAGTGTYTAYLKGFGYHGRTMELWSQAFTVKAQGQSCDLEDTISVHQLQFTTGDEITVSFQRSAPDEEDAVAIYPADHSDIGDSSNNNHLEVAPSLWLFTCGNQECREGVDKGTLTFGTYSLATGSYRAVLGKLGPDGSFQKVLAPSDSFSFVTTEDKNCQTRVSLSKPCYLKGEDIVVEFAPSCSSSSNGRQPSDKVAIYNAEVDYDELARPVAWLYTCGDKHCQEESSSDDSSLSSSWPLPVGEYKTVLIRNNPGGRLLYYESDPFRIVEHACQEPSLPPRLRANVSNH